MHIAIRLALTLLPKNEKGVWIILCIILAPFLLFASMTSSIVTVKHIPATTPEQINFYKEAVAKVEQDTGITVNWKELVAIDAFLFQQDFSKASSSGSEKLAKRFIRIVKKKDKDSGEIITYYYLKSLDTVLIEMVEAGEIQQEDIVEIKRYLLLPWDSVDPTQGLPNDWVPVPSGAGFIFPVVGSYRISDTFHNRINPVTGVFEHHDGIDLAAAEGTPVVAALKGKVIFAQPNGTAGNEVKIQHENGIITRYLHLHTIYASEGQEVEAGDQIGEVGTTGRSTGAHLHFEIHVNGEPVDPAPYIFSN